MTSQQKELYAYFAPIWDLWMTLAGHKRALTKYVKRLPLELPASPRVLDLGCGTGIISFALLRKFPLAQITAVDIEPAMLRQALRLQKRYKISPKQLNFLKGDINLLTLTPGSFDIIVTSGALEYAQLPKTAYMLAGLLHKGGYFLNIGMRNNFLGRLHGVVYRFPIIPPDHVSRLLLDSGMKGAAHIPLNYNEFPSNLLRTGVLARK